MPLKQHPVPQHISSYEFRLVGDMTLKQFGWLAGGTVLALIVYGLPIPDFIKWPLILLFAFLGFAFAFLPFEERPLLIWVTAFIKSVSAPTLFIWRKQAEPIAVFSYRPPVAPPRTATTLQKVQIENYLTNLLSAALVQAPVDAQELKFLANIRQLFQTTFPQPQPVPTAPLVPPPVVPLPPPPKEVTVKAEPQIRPVEQATGPLRFEPPTGNFRRKVTNFKTPVRIINQPIRHNEKALFRRRPKPVEADTGTELPMPARPSLPNILAGMVLDSNEQIVEGAILEIRNEQGLPVRAFKTNKLGQFTIATALANGVYEIEIEKDGLNFDIIKIKAEGKIIQPIKIKAK